MAKKEKNEKKNKKVRSLKAPKTVQQAIPIVSVFPENGIIEVEPGVFSRSYLLNDINYTVAMQADQDDVFTKYSELLNSFGSELKVQLTINNRTVRRSDFEKQVLLAPRNDELQEYREEYNEILIKEMDKGRNNLVAEKYLTISLEADNPADAERQFKRIDGMVENNVKRICKMNNACKVLSTTERLEILYDIYNLGQEELFGASTRLVDGDEVFDFNNLRRLGISVKDAIAPDGLEIQSDYLVVGDKYARALCITNLPSSLGDTVVSDLTDIGANCLFSMSYQSIPQDKALQLVRNKITNISANLLDLQKKSSREGYSADLINPEIQMARMEATDMLDDISVRNQKLFWATFSMVVFADSKEELDKLTEDVAAIGRRHLVTVKKIRFQQLDGLNTTMPLAINKLSVKRTMTTEAAAVFMPYSTQELSEAGGLYYGINPISKNLILFDRRKQKNSNALILGTPGAGKSFSAKLEMLNILLSSDDEQIIVIDPQGEYKALAALLGGEFISIKPGGSDHINPFDLSASYSGGEDELAAKCSFLVGLFTTLISDSRYGLSPIEKAILDKAFHAAYEPYVKSKIGNKDGDPEMLPTMEDVYDILVGMSATSLEANSLATSLEMYVHGSFNLFSHRTNVDLKKRFVVLDIKEVGSQMTVPAMTILMDFARARMMANREKGIRTWIYLDEVHMLLQYRDTADSLVELWKLARKWGGCPCGLTQNVSDLLEHEVASKLLSNSDFILMLNQAPVDRIALAAMLNISDTQLSYITSADSGCGLLYNGKSCVPFENHFPKGKMYDAMTTNISDMVVY